MPTIIKKVDAVDVFVNTDDDIEIVQTLWSGEKQIILIPPELVGALIGGLKRAAEMALKVDSKRWSAKK